MPAPADRWVARLRLDSTLAPPLLCAALLGFAPSAFAQTAIPPTLDACSTESDSAKRLACFDREIARLHQLHQLQRGASAGAQAATAATTRGTPTDAAPESRADSANTSHIAGAPPASAPARAGSNTTVDPNDPAAIDNFGVTPEMQHQRQTEGKAATPLRQISAHVSSVRYLPRGEIVVGLDNGQTWQQAEYDGDVSMDVGEPVTIKTGAFTAYYLKPRVGRIIRVKRLR